METRLLVAALVTILNNAVEELEKLLSADGGEAPATRSRATKKKTRTKPKDEDEDAGDEDEDEEGEEVSEDDVIDAVKAAQKIVDKVVISKILMKYGKAKRATEVSEEHRQRVIDALEKAVADAE